jgi:hypothetical protein
MIAAAVCRARDACAIIPPSLAPGVRRSRPGPRLTTDTLPSAATTAPRVVVANGWDSESRSR